MPRPETPDTSGSSPGMSTPDSHPHSTPPTDLRGLESDTEISRFVMGRKLAIMAQSNESPSLRGARIWAANNARSGGQDQSSSPPASESPWNRLSGGSTSTVVPPRSHPSGTNVLSYAPAGSSVEQEPALQSRVAQYILQNPPPGAPLRLPTGPPIAPLRQPIAPPADHATSASTRQESDASIWEGLSRFSQLTMNESSAPRRVQAPETPLQPQYHPVWNNQNFENQSFDNQSFDNPNHTSAETVIFRSPPAQQQSPSSPRGFRPMAAISHNERAFGARINPREVLPADPRAFSTNYRGEHSVRNASVDDLPFEQNCALWLTNLPPDVTYQQLLAQIRNVGRIWCTVINAPDYERHNTAAAKVVFFTPSPAQRLLQKSLTQGLEVNGYAVKVTHNRVKYGAQTLTGNASRVLIVTGKTTFVNPESLTEFFKARFVFEVDEIIELINQGNRHKGGRSVVEYKFGSFRCQAQMGKMALEKDRPEGFEKVDFGPDPCEVGDTLASYGIAAERIQGKGI
ncbi:uncharacterized protein NECHADRAFT_81265 [Fusarium vanettenii 77-13-4]|uniref:RRM domain-containing protein n=1 Tax=Fusarium vanettenii (strain ATCC MYA-4622 / CBS 123669 / FGSC 9596 / NRRL 45880 / 77-13-4) TaxID=660122 RepID=C7ZHJ4_FUSV7|nr:uncharacterized protein NECHADRAFT_81265 [Fusarium vanettenii 77-13-4]EEU36478.1 hypothetical protein NECHADRAFT_81265 [Fusarium vanettenii 77-13-4]